MPLDLVAVESQAGPAPALPDVASNRRSVERRRDLLERVAVDEQLRRVAETILRGKGTDRSAERYADDIRTFLGYAQAMEVDAFAAGRDDLVAYQRWLLDRYAPASVRRMITVARCLYRELEAKGLLPGPNPTVMLPKVGGNSAKPPEAFTMEQAGRLLDAVDARRRSADAAERYLAIRDFAILYTAMTTGVRASELIALRAGDVARDGDYWVLSVLGKGRKHRKVAIEQDTVDAIESYKTRMLDLGVEIGPADPLFIRIGAHAAPDGARAMTSRNLRRIAVAANTLAGLAGRGHAAHQLRRTAATLAYDGGATVDQVAAMLGHAGTQTTIDHYIRPHDSLKYSATKAIGLALRRPLEGGAAS